MIEPTDAQVLAAIQKACEAFWVAFAAEFPEVTTGDVEPLTTIHFDDAVERAAREWLGSNWPENAAV